MFIMASIMNSFFLLDALEDITYVGEYLRWQSYDKCLIATLDII